MRRETPLASENAVGERQCRFKRGDEIELWRSVGKLERFSLIVFR